MALFLFPQAARHDAAVDQWMDRHLDATGDLAHRAFEALRACGDDVRELLHDGRPTACIGTAAFAYVDAFARHAAIGFFQGAALPDPQHLLEGTGQAMRHVKLRPERPPGAAALQALIEAARDDMRRRVLSPPPGP